MTKVNDPQSLDWDNHVPIRSFFAGMTTRLDEYTHDGNRYLDTPGFSDMELRKQAAAASNKALKMGGGISRFS